ncbi:MAG TPA: ATP-binding protein [Pirellulales bacterium]|nr:ATP-binding protein [Pirellulales bacterium]
MNDNDVTLNLTFSAPMNRHVRHVVRLTRGVDVDDAVFNGDRNQDGDAIRDERHPAARRYADFAFNGALSRAEDAAGQTGADEIFKDGDEHVRLLLDSAAEAICEINRNGNCTFANPACAKLLGYVDPCALVGKNMHALTHYRRVDGTPYPEEECAIHRNYCEEAGAHVEEDVFWRADGSSFYAECRSLPVRRGNQVIGAVVTFLDITDRKQLEEQLRQAQKMEAIGQLVGGIAHDFNNFLTAINIYNELLTTSLGSNVPAQQLLQEIREATQRSASLTRRLLAFGGKQASPPQIFCLNEVVTSAERLLRRVIGDDICLLAVLEPELEKIKADPEQLERVLLNLVVNARHAMPRGGNIVIESANVVVDGAGRNGRCDIPTGRYVMLSVSDTGVGMSQEIKRRIFEPFFTTKGPNEGSGLGLAIVHGIVKQLKGYLDVDSEPGRGACFRIYLPRAEQAAVPRELSDDSSARPRGVETILFVERDESLRMNHISG